MRAFEDSIINRQQFRFTPSTRYCFGLSATLCNDGGEVLIGFKTVAFAMDRNFHKPFVFECQEFAGFNVNYVWDANKKYFYPGVGFNGVDDIYRVHVQFRVEIFNDYSAEKRRLAGEQSRYETGVSLITSKEYPDLLVDGYIGGTEKFGQALNNCKSSTQLTPKLKDTAFILRCGLEKMNSTRLEKIFRSQSLKHPKI